MRKCTAAGILGALGLIVTSGQANAATDTFVYEALPATGNTYTPGATVQYLLYIADSSNGTLLSASNEDGLASAGIAIVPTTSNPASTITGIATNTTDWGGTPSAYPNTTADIAPNGKTYGGYLSDTQSTSQAALNGVLPGNTGGGSVTSPSVANAVFLGTMSILVGSGSTTFNVGRYSTGNNNTLTYENFYDLDATPADGPFTPVGNNVTTFTISTSPTPEPGTLGILGLGAIAGLYRRQRKA